MNTTLTIDRIFKFYEGPDPDLYTELTGINLNKTPRILAEAIDDLNEKVDGLGTGSGNGHPLSDALDLDDSNTGASSKAVKKLKDLIDGFQDSKNPLSDALDLDDSNTSGSSRAIYLLNKKIDNIQVGGGGVPLSDDPSENDSSKAASTTATKKILDMIKDSSDSLDLDDSNTLASSKAVYLLNQKIDNYSPGTELNSTTDTPKGEIPESGDIPTTYIGENGSKYLGAPREWVKIVTDQGEGLVPVFNKGTIIDNRNLP